MTKKEAISRIQRALNVPNRLQGLVLIDEESANMAIKALTNRPIGEWINVNGDGSLWRCDRCKDTACCKGNFCPNCGADMKSEVI